MTWSSVTEYLCRKWPRICSVCNDNPVLSSFMIIRVLGNKNNTTGVTCGAGTAYPSGDLSSLRVRVARSSFLCSVLLIIVFPFVPFPFGHCMFCPSSIHVCVRSCVRGIDFTCFAQWVCKTETVKRVIGEK